MIERNSPPGQGIQRGNRSSGFSRGIPDDDSRMWALFAHISGILTSFVGPLIIWYVKKDESTFVAYHAVQATYWSVITLVIMTVVSVLTCGVGSMLLPFFWLGALYIGLRAKDGEWFGYWGIDGFGRDGGLLK